MTPTALARLALLLACLGAADGARADLALSGAWLAEPPPGAMATAAYGTLRNGGDGPVDLVGFASPDCERVELHRTSYRGGVVSMERISHLELPPGEALLLEPGGTHLMCLVPRALAAGGSAGLTVELGDGTRREFTLPVRRRDAADP